MARRRATPRSLRPAFHPLVVAPCLGAVAAVLHRAPASSARLGAADEAPAALVRLVHAADAHLGAGIGEQARRCVDHRPEHGVERGAVLPSEHDDAAALDDATVRERAWQRGVQRIQVGGTGPPAPGAVEEDAVERLAQRDRAGERGLRLGRTSARLLGEPRGLALSQHARLPPDGVHEIEREMPARLVEDVFPMARHITSIMLLTGYSARAML